MRSIASRRLSKLSWCILTFPVLYTVWSIAVKTNVLLTVDLPLLGLFALRGWLGFQQFETHPPKSLTRGIGKAIAIGTLLSVLWSIAALLVILGIDYLLCQFFNASPVYSESGPRPFAVPLLLAPVIDGFLCPIAFLIQWYSSQGLPQLQHRFTQFGEVAGMTTDFTMGVVEQSVRLVGVPIRLVASAVPVPIECAVKASSAIAKSGPLSKEGMFAVCLTLLFSVPGYLLGIWFGLVSLSQVSHSLVHFLALPLFLGYVFSSLVAYAGVFTHPVALLIALGSSFYPLGPRGKAYSWAILAGGIIPWWMIGRALLPHTFPFHI